MKVTFISNYINHHQIPFCNAMYERLGGDFVFIQTEPMEEERVRMGWAVDARSIPYVKLFYESAAECRTLIDGCDLLLAGWLENRGETAENGLPDAYASVMDRLGSGKPAIRISERIYREGQWKAISPKGLLAKYKEHIRFRKLPVWLLCAGAYVASDFALIGAYPGKKLQFGYFPETREYPDCRKEVSDGSDVVELLWTGRLMQLKHPEFAVRLAEDLRSRGFRFHINLIGNGEMEEQLREEIRIKRLESCITMQGFLPPEQVREYMEKSHIYLFTSNYLEGWGAVVNEAMNSGCAVVGSVQAGSVPYLIRDGENGRSYPDNEYEKFRDAVLDLMEHPEERRRMGRAAYETIQSGWNAETAAQRCIDFYKELSANHGKPEVPLSGPFSEAPVIWPRGFRGENSRWN